MRTKRLGSVGLEPYSSKETIVAQATASGKGGIGVVRLSGDLVPEICRSIVGSLPAPRLVKFSNFIDKAGVTIDQGVAIYFEGPHSFTGENVLELQGHGGPVVMTMLLERCLELGARIARPGEFSERAFLNDKIDLSQAEAIADLIDSVSGAAAKSAVRSLQGEFSRQIKELTEAVVRLRMYVEAAIDFPEEEIDFLADEKVADMLETILAEFGQISEKATQGALLREGVSLVLAGRPNAGKSSLMNTLTGRESSIVTGIAGTTRDIIGEHVHLDGLPLKLIDTAGLRAATNEIEAEGLKRALKEIENADRLLLLVDCQVHKGNIQAKVSEIRSEIPAGIAATVVLNKIDLNESWRDELPDRDDWIGVSAKTGEGVESLKNHLKKVLGYAVNEEGTFIARARHVDALQRAQQSVETGQQRLLIDNAGELLAEELKVCQRALGEITGEFSSDDLLGRIFSQFCVGK